ncbi:MAG: helix-turn-helix domain-containing protein [Nocardiopsaceae bacterium]|nr:helix-turn-helix domain-containing protein [Nocardiopsaceae bacterium]
MLARVALGKELRRLREASGVTREAAGRSIRGSDSKMSRLELGRTGFKSRDVADLCTLYGVTGEAERTALLGLARVANSAEWWHPYRDVIPGWFENYLGLEQSASVIRGYETQFVPGLLQTPDYASAVIRSGHGSADVFEVDRMVELRMRRQDILARPRPPHLWALLDEAVLLRAFGNRATMSAQLKRLLDACDIGHVTIQVLPLRRFGPVAEAPFTVLRLPDPDLPDVAYLEHLNTAVYPDRPADLEYYRHWMNLLTTQAEDADATPDILRRLLAEI